MAASLIAIGSGVLRPGVGDSKQRTVSARGLYRLHPAIIGEELGFAGILGVLLLFAVALSRLSRRGASQDLFGYYLAAGITTMLALQAIVNAGVVLGCCPQGCRCRSYPSAARRWSSIWRRFGILLNVSRAEPAPPHSHRAPSQSGRTTAVYWLWNSNRRRMARRRPQPNPTFRGRVVVMRAKNRPWSSRAAELAATCSRRGARRRASWPRLRHHLCRYGTRHRSPRDSDHAVWAGADRCRGPEATGLWTTVRNLFRLPLSLLAALSILRRLRSAGGGRRRYVGPARAVCWRCARHPRHRLEQNRSWPDQQDPGRFVRSVVIACFAGGGVFPGHKVFISLAIRSAQPSPKKRAASQPISAEPARPMPGWPLTNLGGIVKGATAVNDLFVAALEALALTPCRRQLPTASCIRPAKRIASVSPSAIAPWACPMTSPLSAPLSPTWPRPPIALRSMVGRAGATTIAELTAIGRPALLILFLQAADDHQTHNALHGRLWCRRVLLQDHHTPRQLADRLAALVADRSTLSAWPSAA